MKLRCRMLFLSCWLLSAACSEGTGGPLGAGGSGGSGDLPTCSEACVGVVAAQCANGPPSQQECVTGCEDIRAGSCRTQYRATFDCAGATPDYACSAEGRVTVTGCETEFDTLWACLTGQ